MAETTTDHEAIRGWAERHGGKPAAVKRTHTEDDVGIIRIMFPDAPNSKHDALEEITWDEFFEEFESRELALVYDEKSLFSKIVGRDTAEKRAKGDHDAARHNERQDAGGGARRNGQSDRKESAGRGDENDDLKAREYRDEQGNVHHHTRTYMEQHGKK